MLYTRTYGNSGPIIVAIHGGPAAVGSAAGIARGLGKWFRAIEPWQRGSGEEPLTVRQHVADLHQVIEDGCHGETPVLVGTSWGAMLALAYAAEHPEFAGPLVLVGCGTFDEASRRELHARVAARMTEDVRRQLQQIEHTCEDPGERRTRQHQARSPLFNCDLLPDEDKPERPAFDLRAHTETWNDMMRLQERGVYPRAFRSITSPVLMLHGDFDPHPGTMIRDSLLPYLPQLEFHEFERCGHEPWRERAAHDAFFECTRDWLHSTLRCR